MFLKISQTSQENICTGESHFNKVADLNPTQVFSSEICDIFKNIYFEEHLRTTASKIRTIKLLTIDNVLEFYEYLSNRGMTRVRKYIDIDKTESCSRHIFFSVYISTDH